MIESSLMCDACHHSFTWHYNGQLLPCHQRCACPAFIHPVDPNKLWLMGFWGECWKEAAA